MAEHPLLVKMTRHLNEARAIKDEFEGRPIPAEQAHQMSQHLQLSQGYRERYEREAALEDHKQWLEEPQYKHDMSNGATGQAKGWSPGGDQPSDDGQVSRATKSFLDWVRSGVVAPEAKADLVE